MNTDVNKVYVGNHNYDNLKEIQPEYVYMTIPAEYVCIYTKLLILYVKYGIEMLDDCKASCTDKNKKVIDCYNMFNAAIAARKLDKLKEADVLIKYVKAQLKSYFNGEEICPEVTFPVDEEGKITAYVTCGEKPKFYVDSETGKLWESYNSNNNNVTVHET